MKIKVDMVVVVDKTLGKFPFHEHDAKFLLGRKNYTFVSEENKITMPCWQWEWLIQEYLLMFGFDDNEKSNLKILEKEKSSNDNGGNNTIVLVEIDGWTIPGIKFMENK